MLWEWVLDTRVRIRLTALSNFCGRSMHFIPHPDDAPSPVPDRHIATMATLNLGLPDDLLAYLDEQAFAHGHDDSAQYVVEVLHQHRERQALKSRLINSIKSGPAGFADDQ